MSDYSFIKEFQNIKISSYCKENNINLGNLLGGCTTDENYRKVKNYIIRELLKIMIEYRQDDLILVSLYSDVLEKLEKENKKLKEIIARAIKFVESFDYYIPEDYKPELMDILRGTHE